jgi:hypothetical protein
MEIALVLALIAAAIGAVMWPLLRRDAGAPDPADAAGATAADGLTFADIDREVGRYRDALRAGTVCSRCAQANPPGSRFCSDCGRPLRASAPSPSPVATTT